MKIILQFALVIFCCIIMINNTFAQDISSSDESLVQQYKQLAKNSKLNGDLPNTANYYNKIARIYWDSNSYQNAIEWYKQSLEVNQNLQNKNAIASISANLGLLYSDLQNYGQAIAYFEKSLEVNRALQRINYIKNDLHNMATAHSSNNNYNQANTYLLELLEYVKEEQNTAKLSDVYKSLHLNYKALGNTAEANKYLELYNTMASHEYEQRQRELQEQQNRAVNRALVAEDSLHKTEDSLLKTTQENLVQRLKIDSLNREKELQELALKESEARVKAERLMSYLIAAGLVVVMLIAISIFAQFKQKQKANRLLEIQNKEIKKQKEQISLQAEKLQKANSTITQKNQVLQLQKQEIEEKNKSITEGITYARKIQGAVLPEKQLLNKLFPENFILYQPRDILSGDFYWIGQKNEYQIVVAADCTGHGVPGALMSILGLAFLNEIISTSQHLQANKILDTLRNYVIEALKQTGEDFETKDGMDLALCIINPKTQKMQYAGANNPLYLFRNKELIEMKPNRMPIGMHMLKHNKPFTNHEIDIQHGDTIYLFSDGFVDQLGGPEGKRFMTKHFKKLLADIHLQPMNEQHKILETTIYEWQIADYEQIDDRLIIGFRI